MRMKGKPQDAAIQLNPEELEKDTGVEYLLKELDKLYLTDSTQSIFAAIYHFNTYKRSESETMDQYIREFQQRYKNLVQVRNKGVLYEDGILACQLLTQANLSEEQETLIRTSTSNDLTYNDMEALLKRTFGAEGKLSVSSSSKTGSSNPYYTHRRRKK